MTIFFVHFEREWGGVLITFPSKAATVKNGTTYFWKSCHKKSVLSKTYRVKLIDVDVVGEEAAEEVLVFVAVAESATKVTGVVGKMAILKVQSRYINMG